jgi:hypothetical protein
MVREEVIMTDGTLFFKHIKKASNKVLLTILICFLAAGILGLLITWGLVVCPKIVFVGFVSFAVTCIFIGVASTFFSIKQTVYMKRRYPDSWNKCKKRGMSRLARLDAQAELRSIRDPYLLKMSKKGLGWGAFFIILWVLFFLFVAIGALVFENQYSMRILNIF